jgi:hypothetical protein
VWLGLNAYTRSPLGPFRPFKRRAEDWVKIPASALTRRFPHQLHETCEGSSALRATSWMGSAGVEAAITSRRIAPYLDAITVRDPRSTPTSRTRVLPTSSWSLGDGNAMLGWMLLKLKIRGIHDHGEMIQIEQSLATRQVWPGFIGNKSMTVSGLTRTEGKGTFPWRNSSQRSDSRPRTCVNPSNARYRNIQNDVIHCADLKHLPPPLHDSPRDAQVGPP